MEKLDEKTLIYSLYYSAVLSLGSEDPKEEKNQGAKGKAFSLSTKFHERKINENHDPIHHDVST